MLSWQIHTRTPLQVYRVKLSNIIVNTQLSTLICEHHDRINLRAMDCLQIFDNNNMPILLGIPVVNRRFFLANHLATLLVRRMSVLIVQYGLNRWMFVDDFGFWLFGTIHYLPWCFTLIATDLVHEMIIVFVYTNDSIVD